MIPRPKLAALLLLAAAIPPAHADEPAVNLGSTPIALDDIEITARRLNEARSQIQPSLGATQYSFSPEALQAVPQGENAPLNQVLLQAPGVVQDSFGQIHVRGDHANLQYRLDGVQLPEGLAVFGQVLQTRFAHSLSLITGALPAQYGFRQAGVIDIQTKSGTTDPGGEISLYGGARSTINPSFSYGTRIGAIDAFVTGDYLHNNIGIENPTSSFNAIHDTTNQIHGLAHLSAILDDQTRISLLAGSANTDFQIPNNPAQTPSLGLTVNGVSSVDSATLNQKQRENTQFGILSLQKQYGAADMQLSAFTRDSTLRYSPDPLGDLLFNGVSQQARRGSLAAGVQGDASWKITDTHTLRAGFLSQIERSTASTASGVLPVDENGVQTTDQPFNVYSSSGKTGGLYGVYIQDEWRVLPTVTINAGLRFDAVDQYTHENQVSPRVNVVWKITPTTTLHGGYSRYFTPPPFELVSGSTLAQFAGTTAAPAVFQNDVVRAERAHYFAAGISQQIIPGLTIGLEAYDKQAKNLIDEGQFGAPIILTAFNYATARIQGVELTASYEKGPLSLYANLAYSKARGKNIVSAQFNFDPAELAYIAQNSIYLDHQQPWTSSAGAAYTFNQDTTYATRVSADVFTGSGLRASTDTVPNGRGLPTYAVVNMSVVQKIDLGLGKPTEARLDVLNLFDSTYQIRDGTGVGVGAPQYGLRRTILAGLAQRF